MVIRRPYPLSHLTSPVHTYTETASWCVALVDLELPINVNEASLKFVVILLPLLPQCRNYRFGTPRSRFYCFIIVFEASLLL